MSADYWIENAADPGKHTLLDLGYVKSPVARRRADQLCTVVGRRNLQVVGAGRLLIRIPPTKITRVLREFPQIKPATVARGYCWVTHTWVTTATTELKLAMV